VISYRFPKLSSKWVKLCRYSLASRETCDGEGIKPLCDAVRSEPQQRLPARIRSRTSDLRMRRLWGSPADDPNASQKYLLVLTVVGLPLPGGVSLLTWNIRGVFNC
jgi:hypothetical protein